VGVVIPAGGGLAVEVAAVSLTAPRSQRPPRRRVLPRTAAAAVARPAGQLDPGKPHRPVRGAGKDRVTSRKRTFGRLADADLDSSPAQPGVSGRLPGCDCAGLRIRSRNCRHVI
jgi:hypothetical protein